MPWGLAAGVLGSVAGAVISSDAAGNAADTQARSADAATAETRRQYDVTRADQTPYREQGTAAVNKLAELLGLTGGGESGSLARPFTGENLATEPGYQFGLRQGRQAIESSAAARGGLYSGATGKALHRYGVDYAGTKFNDAFNRDLQTKQLRGNQLAGLSGTGQTAVGQLGVLGANASNQIGQNIMGAGDAQAAAQLASASSYGNAFNQVAGLGTNYLRAQTQPPYVPLVQEAVPGQFSLGNPQYG